MEPGMRTDVIQLTELSNGFRLLDQNTATVPAGTFTFRVRAVRIGGTKYDYMIYAGSQIFSWIVTCPSTATIGIGVPASIE